MSLEHVLNKQKIFYTRLYENKDASLFLKERVQEVKRALKLDRDKVHTKLFSYPQNGYITSEKQKHNLFNCGIKRYGLNFFKIYQSKTFNKFFDFDKLNDFGVNISQLLIPDLNFNIKTENYIDLLTHEGYQLK